MFSDLHIHKHKGRIDRLDDCLKVLDWVFSSALEQKCDHIFFLGDLFHERNKLDILNYIKTFELIFKRCTTDCQDLTFHCLVGNHDMYHKEKWDINSVKPLSAISNFVIYDSPESVILDNVQFDWLPHCDNPIKEIKEFQSTDQDEFNRRKVLLGHLALSDAMVNTFYGTKSDVIVEHDSDMTTVDSSLFDYWDRVFLGHYHGSQQVTKKVEYIGSPLQLSFGESFQQKHLIVLDCKSIGVKYIVNDFSPKHYILPVKDVINEAYDINGNFIRVVLDADTSESDIVDVKQLIQTKFKPIYVDFKSEITKKNHIKATEEINDIQNKVNNAAGLVEEFVDNTDNTELEKQKLIKIGQTLIATVENNK